MNIEFNGDLPIYVQIAQAVEDDILKDIFKAGDMIPSTTEISLRYKINPATVGKGFNILVDEGIIFKKRGIGMFVTPDAREILMEKRKQGFYTDYVARLMEEARKLDISKEEVIDMIKKEGK